MRQQSEKGISLPKGELLDNISGTAKFIDNWESSHQLFTQHVYNSSRVPQESVLQRSLNDEFESWVPD